MVTAIDAHTLDEFSASRTEELDLKRFSEIATAAELVMISLNEKEEQDICDIQLFLWIYEVYIRTTLWYMVEHDYNTRN